MAKTESPSFTAFYGDAERKFSLGPTEIAELERKTGRGISGLCKSLFAGDFRHVELTETIRLSLIGGGEKPEAAAALADVYSARRPIAETLGLAVAVLETAFFGRPRSVETTDSAAAEKTDLADKAEGDAP
jgi:hypothetical protein